ncbi:outer membrane protein [Devosia sp. A449]
MRTEIKLAALVGATLMASVAGAQAQQVETIMILPTVTNQSYQPSYSAWDGFYVGAQGSLVAMKSHEINTGLPGELLIGDIGGNAGIFAGYRQQLNDWFVLGIDAEVNNVATEFEHLSKNYGALKWETAVRATLGYPVANNVLAYATVGYTWGRFDFSPHFGTPDSTYTAGGWQLGLGVDMMVTENLMARLNATWTHYGVNDVTSGGVKAGTSEPSGSVVRAGLAWKF